VFKSRLHIFEFKKNDPQEVFLTSQYGMFTYSDLHRYTAYFQNVIKEKADSAKWPIAFLSESSDLLTFSIAACWKLGIPFIPLDPKLTDEELKQYVKELDPVLIFCDAANRRRLDGDDVIQMDENFFLSAFTFDARNFTPLKPSELKSEQIFGYFFTSGTTGKPKVVPLKRRQMITAAASSAENFRPEKNHFWLLCLPLTHIAGISIILRSLIYGSAIYRLETFHEEMIKEFLGENRLFHAASLVPTMLKRLLDDPLFRTHNEFKAILLGGGPVSHSLLKKAVERGIPVVSSYGMTETCAQIIANPLLQPSGTYTPIQSVGKPFAPNEMEIRDEQSQKRLGSMQSGLLWLKGPQVFDGYFDKKQNKDYFDKDGWFNTGDYGHINGRGQLFIEARRTDLIVTGGENVNPVEVELALENLEQVKEAVVIGVPDEEWGQKVVAVITPENGDVPEIEELRELLRGQLADFKLPKEVRVMKEIPKTNSGKVKRWELIADS